MDNIEQDIPPNTYSHKNSNYPNKLNTWWPNHGKLRKDSHRLCINWFNYPRMNRKGKCWNTSLHPKIPHRRKDKWSHLYKACKDLYMAHINENYFLENIHQGIQSNIHSLKSKSLLCRLNTL